VPDLATVLDRHELSELIRAAVPEDLWTLICAPHPGPLPPRFIPTADGNDPMDIRHAHRLITSSPSVPPFGLVPLCVVDEASIACVVVGGLHLRDGREVTAGSVVRCFWNPVSPRHQMGLLDTDARSYLDSVAAELAVRPEGLERFADLTERYEVAFLADLRTPLPRDERPVGLACQNVVIGMAALRHDRNFDGENASIWQTCEVAHVATNEATRALAAVTLCDAFRSGGTMEVRFEGHLEGGVPAPLRRYGRVHGLELGGTDPWSISPAEARQLFLQVTPLSDALRSLVDGLCRAEGIAPERVCYLLLQGVWSALELEFLLSCVGRAPSILAGGSDPLLRVERQSEMVGGRCARMLGLFHRRLLVSEPAHREDGAPTTLSVLEDDRPEVSWTVHDDLGAATFDGLASSLVPWAGGLESDEGRVTVLPRPWIDDQVVADAQGACSRSGGGAVVVLVPDDADVAPGGLPVARCPLSVAALDRQVDRALFDAEVGRR